MRKGSRGILVPSAVVLMVGCGGVTEVEIDASASDGPSTDGPSADSSQAEDAAILCTSDTWWTDGDAGSTRMRPGHPCIGCHVLAAGSPRFAVAGTIYPTIHEPDDCFGAGGATVQITDSSGKTLDLPVRAGGNFFVFDVEPLVMPIRARVLFEGRVSEMAKAQSSGDCNACHTETGKNGAPGRISLP